MGDTSGDESSADDSLAVGESPAVAELEGVSFPIELH